MNNTNINLLIIDDELQFYTLFRKSMIANYAFEVASTAERGLTLIAQGGWDVVLLDLSFQGQYSYEEGLHKILPEAIKKAKGAFPIIVATSDNRDQTELTARQLGAAGLFRKSNYDIPVWDQRIRQIITEYHNQSQQVTSAPSIAWEDKFVTTSPQMEAIKARLRKLVNYTGSAVLLLGETGTGKEVAARYLHDAKQNAKLPFKAVNLTAFNPNLVESEIFGHVAGAFTGAQKDKKGYFEEVKGGTLFLDEIGEINLELQTKLLRVIQERTFQKVGSNVDIPLEAQLVFATNRNLDKDVAAGKFRQDFYERIKTIALTLLPLRERPEDILPLIERFLRELCPKGHALYGKSAKQCFTPKALTILLRYHWPSNIRELRNTIEQLIFETDVQDLSIIEDAILPMRFKSTERHLRENPEDNATSSVPMDNVMDQTAWPIDKQTAYHELAQIEKELIRAGGRKDDAAKALGLKDDQLLRYRVKTKYFKEYPELFLNFPIIKKVYKF